MNKARVFISCGQKNKFERKVGSEIFNFFKERFDPYFAEQVHTPEALTENIFNALKESEYFVCINFERKNSKIGSLFIQQELAIASFLKIPTRLFHIGKIKRDGIESYLLLNRTKINNIPQLLGKLKKLTSGWDNLSKNQLFLSFGNPHPDMKLNNLDGTTLKDAQGNPILADWYHIIVHNQSGIINVRNAFGYIESITDTANNKLIFKADEYKPELVWAGSGFFSINIPIKGKRDLDAFFYHHKLDKILFHQRSMSTHYRYPELSRGKYSIIYVIISDNISTAKIEVSFEFGNGIESSSSKQI